MPRRLISDPARDSRSPAESAAKGAYCGRRCADAQMVEVELGETLTAEGEPLPPEVYAQLGIEPFINCCGEDFHHPHHSPRRGGQVERWGLGG